ncbi:MAG: BrnT family toxin [Burkholderiales bacterium]|nr:BrnT family toxin [Burkholderiales bacterium]
MRFEWDRRKADANLAKHGVSFDEAASVFFDGLSATIPDPDHSIGQERYITMGVSSMGRLLVVAHAETASALRIISARPASASERKRYED